MLKKVILAAFVAASFGAIANQNLKLPTSLETYAGFRAGANG